MHRLNMIGNGASDLLQCILNLLVCYVVLFAFVVNGQQHYLITVVPLSEDIEVDDSCPSTLPFVLRFDGHSYLIYIIKQQGTR